MAKDKTEYKLKKWQILYTNNDYLFYVDCQTILHKNNNKKYGKIFHSLLYLFVLANGLFNKILNYYTYMINTLKRS
jgi:hypothetical protein